MKMLPAAVQDAFKDKMNLDREDNRRQYSSMPYA